MYNVTFENVGRSKRSWKAELKRIDEGTLTREVHAQNAIASQYPEFVYEDETKTGKIYAGFNMVGTFKWEKSK